jgi:hypothetical protein
VLPVVLVDVAVAKVLFPVCCGIVEKPLLHEVEAIKQSATRGIPVGNLQIHWRGMWFSLWVGSGR